MKMCGRADDPSMHDKDEEIDDDQDADETEEDTREEWRNFIEWQHSLGAEN